ncbi:efflux RND transporter permease subunit, partial [Leclercia adecarboxylata]
AVLISGVVALTLSPMMCSKLLRHEENSSGFAHRLDELFERLKQRYQRSLHGTLNTRPVVLVFAVLVLALIPALLMFTESELAPEEDQGIVFMMASAPKTANLDYLNAYTDQFLEIFQSFPEYY